MSKIILIILSAFLSTITAQMPFCIICDCTAENSENQQITCSDIKVDQDLFDSKNWINLESNTSYPIKTITFRQCNFFALNGEIPKSDLETLDLTNNAITAIGKGFFKNLQSLRQLTLSKNNLHYLIPEVFRGLYAEGQYMPLKSLTTLILSHNKLSSLHEDVFDNTTQIQILNLNHNPLKKFDSSTTIAISSLLHLKELYLSTTMIQTLPTKFLHYLKNLVLLDLSNNPIQKIPETLAESKNLQYLNFNNTNIITLGPDNRFPKIPTLTTLHISENLFLESVKETSLSGLSNLKELYLSNNKLLSFLHPEALVDMRITEQPVWPHLTKLHLHRNKLEVLDEDFLARWDQLTELDISENPWSCDSRNQWMVDTLFIIYEKLNNESAWDLTCAYPIEMKGRKFHELHNKHYIMRALDIYGAHPEYDSVILVGILAGILLTIPLVLLILYMYRRNYFGNFNNSPPAYYRQFYSKVRTDENNIQRGKKL